MPSSKVSPARSQGVTTPHTRTPRRSRSVCSAKSNTSIRLTTLISDSFKLTPIANRQSVLNDDTDIEIPGRKSWWKKLSENSRDMTDVLENRDIADVNNVAEEFDVEILSQEKKNYSIDLPESSDGESINSIVIPQRKLFTQKENQAQKKFGYIIDNRETLAKLQKSHVEEKEIKIVPKNLFNQAPKTRTKPAFPAALLNISSKTVNKTKEMPTEVKGQVRNLFGNRPGTKRKNMFADFIVSESEDEIPDIQPKVLRFQKNNGHKRRESSASRGLAHSPTSSIDLEMDDWKLLPSSTMVENQLEEAASTPVKRPKLSKLSEVKESETINTNSSVNRTKQSNKSINSKNKSKNSSKLKLKEGVNESLNLITDINNEYVEKNNETHNSSNNIRVTRNKSKSIRESPSNEKHQSKISNNLKNTVKSKQSISGLVHKIVNKSNKDIENDMEANLLQTEKSNISTEQVPDDDEEDFTLEYENDDEQINQPTHVNKPDSNNQLIEDDNDIKNTTLKEHQSKIGFQDGSKQKMGEEKEIRNKSITQKRKDDQESDKLHIEERVQPNKQQNQSLINKSVKKDQMNQSQNIVKHKEQTLTYTQNNSREFETDNMDGDNNQMTKNNPEKIVETNYVNCADPDSAEIEKEDEGQNECEPDIHQQDEQKMSIDEESVEAEEEVETNQTMDEQNDSDESEHEKSVEAEEEVDNDQTVDNERIDSDESEHEKSIDAEEEVEINETVLDMQNNSDECSKHEGDDEVDESDHVNSDDQENIDSEVDQNKTNESEMEEQNESETDEQNESEMEEQIESETDEQNEMEEQNESENQEDADNAESDDNLQNESNLSQNEEEEEEVVMESDQGQSDIVDNEVAEIVTDESDDHDTTGRHRKKNVTAVKSPEVILQNKINEMESFTAIGRNTSIRKTKSMIKNLNIRPSLAPVRESTGISDGTRDSTTDGSGWDSHRTTRKTIRLTLGKGFSPKKSLRALVMEKSAKRNTNFNEILADNSKIPQANSTELPAFDSYQEAEPEHVDETVEEPSDHEVSRRTRQTTLELYLQKIKQENLQKKLKMEEEVRASLKAPSRDTFNSFKIPLIPVRRMKPAQNKPKPKQTKSSLIPLNMLPTEVIEDMKYKPPKRFQPSNASWITKRLYKFLESKLEPKYDYKARVRAERLVELLYAFSREARRGPSERAVDTLKKEMARLDIVKTHFEFYEFFHEFMPREIRVKVVPDVVNQISLPKHGVFSDIMQ